jgi:hypothetical protein
MKPAELFEDGLPRLNILEVLDTKPAGIKWKQVEHQNVGTFQLDGDDFEIQLDEFVTVDGKSVVDFGFTKNGKSDLVGSNKSAAKIIGSVLNGATTKIEQLNPDIILISVFKKTGGVESRKSLYATITKWMQRRTGYTYSSDWMENKDAFFKIVSKDTPSPEDITACEKAIRNK